MILLIGGPSSDIINGGSGNDILEGGIWKRYFSMW